MGHEKSRKARPIGSLTIVHLAKSVNKKLIICIKENHSLSTLHIYQMKIQRFIGVQFY